VSSDRAVAGRIAREEGHIFESLVSEHMSSMLGMPFIIKGGNKTKVDLMSQDGLIRVSLKNAKGQNTQVALMTQESFISSMNIHSDDLKLFMSQFFGGDRWSNYPRHRLKCSEIDPILSTSFLNFLNLNKKRLFELLITHGTNETEFVNFLLWTNKKNSIEHLCVIDLEKFLPYYMSGNWYQNETTFEYRIDGKKLLHLQMKGSGSKYTSNYHGLMFHIYGARIDTKYVDTLEYLKGIKDDHRFCSIEKSNSTSRLFV